MDEDTPSALSEMVTRHIRSDGSRPRYPAYCNTCVYVCRQGPFDVWECSGSFISGFVWRYGPGPNYTTMPEVIPGLYAQLENISLHEVKERMT